MDLTWAKKQTALWPFPAYAKVPRIPTSGDFWSTILRCGKGRGMRAHWKWQGLQKQKDLFRKKSHFWEFNLLRYLQRNQSEAVSAWQLHVKQKSWTCRKCSFNEVLCRFKEVEGAVCSPGFTIELQQSTELVCVCTCLYTRQHGYLLPCMSELEGCKKTLDVKPGWVCGRWQSHHEVCVPFKGGHITFKRGLFSVPA